MPTTRKQILHTRKLAPFRLYLVGGVNDVQSSVQFALILAELRDKKGRERVMCSSALKYPDPGLEEEISSCGGTKLVRPQGGRGRSDLIERDPLSRFVGSVRPSASVRHDLRRDSGVFFCITAPAQNWPTAILPLLTCTRLWPLCHILPYRL